MVALRHKGRPNERPLEVTDDAVDYWSQFGYMPVEDEKKPAPKTTSRTRKASAKSSTEK